MVRSVTNFSRNGLADWLLQRVSAVILASYFVFILYYLISSDELQFSQWQSLFSYFPFQLYSTLAIFSLIAHSWIGLWVVVTDYIKHTLARFIVFAVIALLNCSYLIVGLSAIWSF